MDIYQALKNDHEEFKKMLSDLVSLQSNDDFRFILIGEILSVLVPHVQAEEAVFYNAIRSVDADTGIIMNSFKEHAEAELALKNLGEKDNAESDWKKAAKNIKEAIEHHIQEEENKTFSIAKKAFSAEEAIQIGKAFTKLKAEIAAHGNFKTSFDVVANYLPQRISIKIKNMNL